MLPEILAEIRKSKAPLVDIKWCHDGDFFLVASEDGRVLHHAESSGSSLDVEMVCTIGIHSQCPRLHSEDCLLYTSPSPRDATLSRMPSSA